MTERKLFGTDGIRGVANQFPMTCETALNLGRAVAHQARHGEHRHRILIGKDTRLSGYLLEEALACGIVSMRPMEATWKDSILPSSIRAIRHSSGSSALISNLTTGGRA